MGITFLVIQPLILFVIFSVVWRYSTRFLGFFSRTFGGTGDREKVQAVIGYSLLPVLIGWTLAWLMRALANTVSSDQSYASVEEAIVSITQSGVGGVGNFFIVIGWLWATVLGVLGISRATRISHIESIIVAGLPYLMFMSVLIDLSRS